MNYALILSFVLYMPTENKSTELNYIYFKWICIILNCNLLKLENNIQWGIKLNLNWVCCIFPLPLSLFCFDFDQIGRLSIPELTGLFR